MTQAPRSDRITVEAAVQGKLSSDDVRMDPEVLLHQADQAERHGNPQLADNLRRAAELAVLADDRVLALYESLRPSRSTEAELQALVGGLRADGATRCAALVEDALRTYRRRGLLR